MPARFDADRGAPLAPRWHTTLLVALMVAVAVAGTLLTALAPPAPPPPPPGSTALLAYLPMILVQWSLAFYVCNVGRAENAWRSLLGERWFTPRRAVVDLALAATLFIAVAMGELAYARFFGVRHSASIASIAPHTLIERIAWVVVAVSVGICEELVYRGYLQTQLGAFARSALAGVALQALLFGMAHGEQGLAAALRFALYGVAFGIVAQGRRSLLPGIVCHVAIDLVGGLFGR